VKWVGESVLRLAQRAELRQVRRFYQDSDAMFSRPRPDESRPPGTDLIPKIRHVVLLMMENHSFDNYLGTLGHGEGLPLSDDGTPAPVEQGGKLVRFVRDGTTKQLHDVPSQSWHAEHLQYADGSNSGFCDSVRWTVADATPEQIAAPMRYWSGQDLPFYAGLASTYPLADHWFGSCLGPTFPNRRFLLAGTADGLINDLVAGMVNYPKAGTIFDLLTRNHIHWINYHAVSRPKLVRAHMLGRGGQRLLRRIVATIIRLVPILRRTTRDNVQLTANLYPLSMFSAAVHLRSHRRFFADAANGTLPPVSLVDPDFTAFSEENPQDIALGEQFAARVINAVMDGPGWRDTLLIWFYDENGGYYDHVPPPAAVEPDDKPGRSLLDSPAWIKAVLRRISPTRMATIEATDGDSTRRYDRYGFRVPAVVVSPYARPGAVISDVFDHTSVLRLIEDKWNLPSLTARDAAAKSPLVALDLAAAPHFATPPDLPAPRLDSG
jgi:phospholipase C